MTDWLASLGPWDFWGPAMVLLVLVTVTLVRAVIWGKRDTGASPEYDLQVYRDQLREIERDAKRGTVPPEEAERLRTEVARRMLAADTSTQQVAAPQTRSRGGAVAAAGVGALLAAGSLGGYLWIGAPGFGDFPLELRKSLAAEALADRPGQALAEAQMPPTPDVDASPDYLALVDQLRAAMQDRPDDVQGFRFLVRSEAALGNYIAAYSAQARVVDLLGDEATSQDHAILADLLVQAAGGYVSPEAERALRASLTLDPRNGLAQYYIGQMFAQNGRPDRAFRIWRGLLETSTPDAPWVPAIRAQIEELAWLAGESRYVLPPEPGAPGPSAEDIAAAQALSPEERAAMIEGMVAQLSDRLATQGGPAEDWARLIRAYGVLGDRVAAQAIYVEAREVFAGDDAALRQIYTAAQEAEIVN